MKKKLLAALLAAAMLTGLASATFAESTGKSTGGTEETPVSTTATISKVEVTVNPTEAAPGATVTVSAVAKKNDGSTAIDAQFTYTSDKGTVAEGKLTVPTDAKDGDVITVTATETTSKVSGKATVKVVANSGGDNENPGGDTEKPDDTDKPVTPPTGGSTSGGSSSSGGTTSTTPAEETVSTTEAVSKVEQAIAAADADATVVVVRIRNAKSITAAALKAVLKAAVKAEKAPIVHADVTKDGKVESRLYIDPSLMKGNGEIKLGVTLGDEKVTTKFDKYFKNDIAVVKFDQTGSFGMSIKAAVKLDLSKLDTKALVFYSYNPKTNTYTKMTAPNYRIDANGYLHFTTSMGNCVIVTDQPLARK